MEPYELTNEQCQELTKSWLGLDLMNSPTLQGLILGVEQETRKRLLKSINEHVGEGQIVFPDHLLLGLEYWKELLKAHKITE